VQQDHARRARRGKRVGHVAVFVALAVVPVLALNSLAAATPGSHGGSGDARPGLTDSQRQCLAERGVTAPSRGSAGGPALTPEQRSELRAAGRACGVRGTRARPGSRALTDEQRECLSEQGVGGPPQSTEDRAALRSAAEACGLPARGHHGGPGAAI
jgi:hypothetical protein